MSMFSNLNGTEVCALNLPVTQPKPDKARMLIWKNGKYELVVKGATDQECLDGLNDLLLGQCKHYAAEFTIIDAPRA